MWVW